MSKQTITPGERYYRVNQYPGDPRRAPVMIDFERTDRFGNKTTGCFGDVLPEFEAKILSIPDMIEALKEALCTLDTFTEGNAWTAQDQKTYSLITAALRKAGQL